MKKICLFLVCCCLVFSGYAQIPVAYWSMETVAHNVGAATVTDGISTAAGSAITATGLGALAYTAGPGITLHAGTAAGEALLANGDMSNVFGDPTTGATTYWQFNFATTGLSTITMTFDEDEGTANGVKYGVLYSTTGTAGSWTFVSSVTTLNGNTMGTAAGWATAKITLPAACNNAAAVYIRIYGYARTGVSTFAVDNITILGATTIAGAAFTTANEKDIYNMVTSGSTGQTARNSFTATGAATNVTINNVSATSGISMAAGQTFNVTAAATVTFGNTGIINGAGSFSLASGCTLATANTVGLMALGTASGSVETTTARTLNAGANYVYDAIAAQNTGTGLPATITTGGSVKINNAAGVALSQSTTINSGATLTLTSGTLAIGANNLILGVTSTLAGAFSNAAMIIANSTGMVEKQMTANGSFLYPVGDAVPNYTPITLDFTAGVYAGGAYAGINLANVKDPNNADTTNYINRYWSITTSGITAPTYNMSATYVAGDVVGSDANMAAAEYTGTLPWMVFGPANTGTHTLTSTGVSNLTSAFTGIAATGPTVTSSANTSICAANPTTLSVASVTASSSYAALTYTWLPATALSATTGVTVIASPTVTTTYTVTVTDGNGFTDTATTTVTVTPGPTAILGTNNVCITSSLMLSDLTLGGLWTSSFPGIASIDPSSGIVTGNDAGVTDITYTITSSGCYVTALFTVNALPAVAPIGGITNECLGLTVTLTETTTGGIWSSTNPAIASVMASGMVTGNALGTTTMSYTFTDGFGCVSTVTTADTVNSFPVVDAITGLSGVCVNSSITLSDDSLTGVWSSSNIALATINAANGLMTGISAGALTITYTVTNMYGCATPVTTDETVNALPSVLPVTGSNNECAGITMQLNDAIAGGTWSSVNTGIATISSTGVVTGIAPGSDNISYTVSSAFGCINAAVYAITIGNAMPASAVLPADTSVTLCHGNPQNLVVNTTGSGLTYQWYMDSSPIMGATNGSYIATVPGQYIVQLNNGTCALALPYTDVIAPPDPIIGYNGTGPSLFTGDFYTYQWFRNDTAITAMSSGSSSAVLPVTLPGLYTVVVSDANGCFDTSATFAYPIDTTTDTTTGISNVSNNANITVFPNPGNSMIHINAPVSVNVFIMSIDGKIVLTQKQATDINISMLPGGMYIIRICDENNVPMKNLKFTKTE